MSVAQSSGNVKYEFDEDEVLNVVLAAIHVHRNMNTYPTYLCLVAPPSIGKTSTLNCLNPEPIGAIADGTLEPGALIALDRLTPQTLASGLEGKTGLLERGLEDAIILVRELSSLDTRPQDLKPILGDIRRIFDGEFDAAYGTGKTISWKGRITFIMAGVHHPGSLDSELGARILTLRMAEGGIDYRRILEGHTKDRGKEDYVMESLKRQTVQPTQALLRQVEAAAQALALLRGTVRRDRSHAVTASPIAEARFRLVGQLGGLAAGLATVLGCDVFDDRIHNLIWRIVACSAPPRRMVVIEALLPHSSLSVTDLNRKASDLGRFSETTAHYAVEDLTFLGIVHKTNGKPVKCSLAPRWKTIADRLLHSRN